MTRKDVIGSKWVLFSSSWQEVMTKSTALTLRKYRPSLVYNQLYHAQLVCLVDIKKVKEGDRTTRKSAEVNWLTRHQSNANRNQLRSVLVLPMLNVAMRWQADGLLFRVCEFSRLKGWKKSFDQKSLLLFFLSLNSLFTLPHPLLNN